MTEKEELAKKYGYKNDYETAEDLVNLIPNYHDVSEIEVKDMHCTYFCPIGQDWSTCTVKVTYTPKKFLVDLDKLEEFVEKRISGMTGLVEDVCLRIFDYCMLYDIASLSVEIQNVNTKVTKKWDCVDWRNS